MNMKVFLIILSLVSYSNCAGMLRRTPKVYNALITTDENLTPSRAFPVIQPTIHETGIAHYPYGPYNPYRIYHPPIVHLNSPFESRETESFLQHHHHHLHPQGPPYESLTPPTGPYHQIDGSPYETNQIGSLHAQQPPLQMQPAQIPQPPPPPPQQQNKHHLGPIPQQGYPRLYPQQSQLPQLESNLSEIEQKQDQLPVIPAQSNEKPSPPSPQQPPIPLNEFGLPPSLIPLQTYQPHNPQLPPYTFSTYPLIYDQFNHYHPGQDHYLPHFDYYPPHSYGIPIHRPGKNRPKNPSTSTSTPSTAVNDIDPILNSTDSVENITEAVPKPQRENNVPLDNIKNGIENKNANIPDVPPPPLPAGAKKAQRIITL
ncbi:putative uncharacterized protein DDB_G0291608 [Condylostylus longicornis]|uniref:putative uncharacterized protein DDB_G0291608 n=1 Tax=Condylostylus longicornis TaxID=2530218 RepID=UPI00244DF090|nr:putative uncharacterized protein DDB_G0291608 [Condylostylus longicornis]